MMAQNEAFPNPADLSPGFVPYVGASVTPNTAMGGMWLARARVASYLSLAMPQYAPQLMNWMGLTGPAPYGPTLLPVPTGYYDYDPPVLDMGNMPFQASAGAGALVFVGATGNPQTIQYQQDALANPTYGSMYNMAATVWVQTRLISTRVDINAPKNAWRAAILARDNLVNLMKVSILLQRDLGTQNVARVEVNSMTTETPPPLQQKGPTYICGGALNFRLLMSETLTIAPLGIVGPGVGGIDSGAGIQIDTPLLPVHPALYDINTIPVVPPGLSNP